MSATRSLADAAASGDNGFHLVRLLAALAVVYLHAYINTGIGAEGEPVSAMLMPVADVGQIALAVFFLVSGFFVTRSWMQDPHLWRFGVRRAVRLLPGLAVCVLSTTLVAVLCFSDENGPGLTDGTTWRYILGNISLHGLRFDISATEWHIDGVLGGTALNSSLWTLFWEGRMYVMVALIGFCAALPLRQWLTGVAVLLLLATQLAPQVASGYLWEQRLWSMFLAGMLCCGLASQLRVGPVQVAGACIFVALNWTRTASMSPSGFTWFGIALASGCVALWIGGARLPGLAHLRRHDYSYGIYLYHWPVMVMLKAAVPPLTAMPLLGLALLVTVPLAMLSWHYVESPALRWSRRRPAGRVPVRAVEGVAA